MKRRKESLGHALAASENTETWRKLCALLSIELLLLTLAHFHSRVLFGETTWWIPVTAGVVAVCLGVLLRSGAQRIFLTEMILAVSSTAVLTCVLLNSQRKMEAGIASNTFDGFKLFIIAVALMAFRNWRMGATLMALATLIPVAQYYSWPAEWRESVGSAAFSVLLYAVIGTVCYLYGYRSQKSIRRLLQRDLEASELKRFARAMLSAKDLSNTPLQVLKGTIALVERDPSALQEHLARMSRACARLEELNAIFSKYESSIDWGSAESLDSAETLAAITEDWEKAKLP